MRVLICGGRKFDDLELLTEALDLIDDANNITVVIHGAAKGADELGGLWGEISNKQVLAFPADWEKYGRKSAGPIRNQQMIDEGYPEVIIAFPGGSGTYDMKIRGRQNDIFVVEVKRKNNEIVLREFI